MIRINNNNNNLIKKSFLIGIFFLPSAPALSFIFLLLTAIISFTKNLEEIFSEKWNWIFIASIILLPLISFNHNENLLPLNGNWDKSLTWIGLSNWLPLMFCFLSFQKLLKSPKDREHVSKALIAGSFPIILSGLTQYFLKWYGPYDFLNGFIIWFQRPIQTDVGLTSIFNNQNYAGSWFCIIWPLCLASFLSEKDQIINKSITISFLISVTVVLILTTSRNAWGGMILLIPLMTGISSLYWLLPVIIICFLFISLTFTNIIPNDLQVFFQNFLPEKIWQEFIPDNFLYRESRLEIWYQAIQFILKKPLYGWGAATFPILYFSVNQSYVGHAHNLILELALSYGIPVTVIIFTTIILISFFSFVKIFLRNKNNQINLYERAWVSSFFILLLSQMVDIQYFDGRISLIFWIQLAGLIAIIKPSHLD